MAAAGAAAAACGPVQPRLPGTIQSGGSIGPVIHTSGQDKGVGPDRA